MQCLCGPCHFRSLQLHVSTISEDASSDLKNTSNSMGSDYEHAEEKRHRRAPDFTPMFDPRIPMMHIVPDQIFDVHHGLSAGENNPSRGFLELLPSAVDDPSICGGRQCRQSQQEARAYSKSTTIYPLHTCRGSVIVIDQNQKNSEHFEPLPPSSSEPRTRP